MRGIKVNQNHSVLGDVIPDNLLLLLVAGLALIILAWLSGAAFLASQQNTLSLWMALGFMGALVAYILGYSLSRSLDRKL